MDDTTPHDYGPLLKRAYRQLNELKSRLQAMESAGSEVIAVVGMACRFPGSDDPEAFWQLLRNKRHAIREIPKERWDTASVFNSNPDAPGKTYSRWAGFLDHVDSFDAGFFGISPREAMNIDPQQRLLLEVAWEALEDAGQIPDRLAGSRTGVFVGICGSDYGQIVFRNLEGINAYSGTGTALSVVAGRLSYFLDLRGPSVAIDTACSSSLVAVHNACQSLRNRETDLALAGGVSLTLVPESFIMGGKMRVFAPDGKCKPFDAAADGIVGGEGCGIVVLKRQSDALRDGDRILALIKGSAVNQDGRSVGLTAPNGLSQQAVIREALHQAGLSGSEVSYLEAHGTGTTLGDPIEVEALTSALMTPRDDRQVCAIGAVKANIGHLIAAAGISGLIKTVLCLQHAEIPPQINLNKLNPSISLPEKYFIIPTEAWPWTPRGARYAGVSSFGWAGTNCHVILGEAPSQTDIMATEDDDASSLVNLLPLSARSENALHAMAEAYEQSLITGRLSEPPLRDVCYTASARRTHHQHRLAVVCATHDECGQRLSGWLKSGYHEGVVSDADIDDGLSKLAFVFSGQGIQIDTDLNDLKRERGFRNKFAECETAIEAELGTNAVDELRAAPTDEMNSISQLRIFIWQVALAEMWRSYGVNPDGVVGHSLGEIAAAHTAGVLTLKDAVHVVSERGRVMHEELAKTTERGVMAVVKLDFETVQHILSDTGGEVSIAAHNSPDTVVISGATAAVTKLVDRFERQGIRAYTLALPAGHSRFSEPWRAGLVNSLKRLECLESGIPIYSTVTGSLRRGMEFDVAYWGENLRQTVRFVEAISEMLASGYDAFLEISGHPVLTAAVTQIANNEGRVVVAVGSLQQRQPARISLLGTLAALYVNGYEVDWDKLYQPPGRCVSLPAYPWQRERFWMETQAQRDDDGARKGSASNAHPILRWHSDLALESGPGNHVYEGEIGRSLLPYLSDHRVEGTMIVPGTCFLDLVLAAARESCRNELPVLKGVEFKKALFLTDSEIHRVQLLLSPKNQDLEFQICSKPTASQDDSPWVLHVIGRIVNAQVESHCEPAESLPVDEIKRHSQSEMESTDFYSVMRGRGNHWGPAFQGIKHLWLEDGRALGRIRTPEMLSAESSAYPIHPAVLDACVQVIAAATGCEDDGTERGAWVGVGVNEIRLCRRPEGTEFWALASLGNENPVSVADVQIFDSECKPVIDLRGVRIQYLSANWLDLSRADQQADWFYELQWLKQTKTQQALTVSNNCHARATTVDHADPIEFELADEWLIFEDGSGLGEKLAHLISTCGKKCTVVTHGKQDEQIEELIAQFFEANTSQAVIYLAGMDSPEANLTTSEILAAQEHGCLGGFRLVQSSARHAKTVPAVTFVTRKTQSILGEKTPRSITHAPMWGMKRTISHEHPEMRCRIIDLDLSEADEAKALFDELIHPHGEDEIALRDDGRYVARLVPALSPLRDDTKSPLRADGTYVITGGLGGIGFLIAEWMIEQGARHLVLLARSKPNENQLLKLDALRQIGAEITTIQVDVADPIRMAEVLTLVRESMPPLRGVIHSAAHLEDGAILNLNKEKFLSALGPKIGGAWNLHTLTKDLALDFFVLFSSMASVVGSPGQANYAAGNAFLDALAYQRRSRGLKALSINWGPWGQVGRATTPQVERRLADGLIRKLTPEKGLEIFAGLVNSETIQISVFSADWVQLVRTKVVKGAFPILSELVARLPEQSQRGSEAERLTKTRLQAAEPASRQKILEDYLIAEVARTLKTKPERISRTRPLNRLGMDSLMALELKNGVELAFGITVPLTNLLRGDNISQLSAALVEQLDFANNESALKTQQEVKPTEGILTGEPAMHETGEWQEGEI